MFPDEATSSCKGSLAATANPLGFYSSPLADRLLPSFPSPQNQKTGMEVKSYIAAFSLDENKPFHMTHITIFQAYQTLTTKYSALHGGWRAVSYIGTKQLWELHHEGWKVKSVLFTKDLGPQIQKRTNEWQTPSWYRQSCLLLELQSYLTILLLKTCAKLLFTPQPLYSTAVGAHQTLTVLL